MQKNNYDVADNPMLDITLMKDDNCEPKSNRSEFDEINRSLN
jgi:hypothetical protein